MNNKGFTMIEVLSVFVVIGLISGVAMISYGFILDLSKDNYYRILKSHLLLAGNDYFEEHRGDVLGSTISVPIERLVREEYIDEVKDSNGNICRNGEVVRYKGDDHKFHYAVCLQCDNYTMNDEICS